MALQLQCAVQNYAWGKSGENSLVAQLVQSVCKHFQIDHTKQYSELWMGTHPSGPGKIVGGASLLKDWIQQNPDCLGSKVRKTFGNDLPFLFKVLSVGKALSIQAHPSKSHAEELHRLAPDKYPDDNHKPEMAIALTPFQALCGFRPFVHIQTFLRDIPELQDTVGEEMTQRFLRLQQDKESERSLLKECFTALMTCSHEKFSKYLDDLIFRLSENPPDLTPDVREVKDLVLRIHSQFPGDIGCFGLLFLNYIELNPGQALYLAANEPHAYLYGDCVECMACSDNVVRAGLTPKFKDVATLCEMLTYDCKAAADNIFPHCLEPNDPFCSVYNPPIKDFAVDRISVPSDESDYVMNAKDSASILLMVEGKADVQGIFCTKGSVLFVPAGQALHFRLEPSPMLMFRAYTPL